MLPRGRIAKPFTITEVRELTPEETSVLREPRATPNRIAKFRDSHHRVAMLFALGYKIGEVCSITGYSHTRILTLKSTPSFEDLIAQKRERVEQAHIEVELDDYEVKTQIRKAADRHLLDYFHELDEAGEIAPPRVALAASADMSDRTGYAKLAVQANVDSKNFAELLEKTIRRSGKTIDASIVPSSHRGAPAPPKRVGTSEPQLLRRRV